MRNSIGSGTRHSGILIRFGRAECQNPTTLGWSSATLNWTSRRGWVLKLGFVDSAQTSLSYVMRQNAFPLEFHQAYRYNVLVVQAMYSLLKDGLYTSVPLMATLLVSVNGALWNLWEETWWQITLRLGNDPVTYAGFINQWNRGLPLYIDSYESILLVACRHNLRRPPLMVV